MGWEGAHLASTVPGPTTGTQHCSLPSLATPPHPSHPCKSQVASVEVPRSSGPCVLFLSQFKHLLSNLCARHMLSSTVQPWSLPHKDRLPLEHDLKNHLKCLLASYFQYFNSLVELWSFLQQAFLKNENLQSKRKDSGQIETPEV